MSDYGKCSKCGTPFKHGETTARIQMVAKYQSQGYPAEFVKNQLEFCLSCVKQVKDMFTPKA
jgi:hypothetical protein